MRHHPIENLATILVFGPRVAKLRQSSILNPDIYRVYIKAGKESEASMLELVETTANQAQTRAFDMFSKELQNLKYSKDFSGDVTEISRALEKAMKKLLSQEKPVQYSGKVSADSLLDVIAESVVQEVFVLFQKRVEVLYAVGTGKKMLLPSHYKAAWELLMGAFSVA